MAKKKLSSSNYFKLALIIIGVVLLTLFVANIYRNILDAQVDTSYLAKDVASVISYNEIKSAMVEFSGDTFLYISHTGTRDIYNLEVKLKRMLKDYDLMSSVIYLDMNEHLETNNYLGSLNEALGLTNKKINKIPAIAYYRDGELVEIIDSASGLLSSDTFHKLLEKYEIIND